MERNGTKPNEIQKTKAEAGWWVGALLALLTAIGVCFGLHPHYRIAAAGLAAVAVLICIKRNWWWPLSELTLLSVIVLLWTFGPAGYRYASLVPLLFAVFLSALRFGKRSVRIAACVLCAAILLCFAVVEVPILSAAQNERDAEADYVIVLGAAVYGETPSISLKNRMDRAIDYLTLHPAAKVIASGGQGEGEDISEAECMRRYLLAHGVDESRILTESHSTSTMENLAFSKAVMEADGGTGASVAIVSSAYHLYRAKTMAASLGMDAIGLASSDGYPVYMGGMYLREALGVVKLWLFGNWERQACLSSSYAAFVR